MTDIYQVTMTWNTPVAGDVAQCVFAVEGIASEAADINEAVEDAWTGGAIQINENISTDFTLVDISSEFYGAEGKVPSGIKLSRSVAIQGENASTSLPPNCTWMFSKSTAQLGPNRVVRGRMYVPGIAENQADAAGRISALTAGGQSLRGAEFLAQLTAGGHSMYVIAADPLTDAGLVLSLNCSTIIGTQRRRLRV